MDVERQEEIQNEEIKSLLLRAKEGDSDAFGIVYNTYLSIIYKYMYFRVKDKELADDLTQTVFTKIFANISSIDPVYPRAYFFTVAKNTLTDHWKKKKDVLFNESDEEYKMIPSEENLDEEIDLRSESNRIKSLLHKLKDDQKEALTLRFMQELSTAEISKIMGKSEGTVRQLQCRGLKELRELAS
jgi:RNA polymerase sigma-70 factor (ECF subfamily)